MQNRIVGRFDCRLQEECLDETLFTSLIRARFALSARQHDYHTVRPHPKLGGMTSVEIAKERVWGRDPIHFGISSGVTHEGT